MKITWSCPSTNTCLKIWIPCHWNVSQIHVNYIAISGFKYIKDLLSTDTLSDVGAHILDMKYPTRQRWGQKHDPSSDEYLEERITQNGHMIWHPAGTCKMGAKSDATAVVDPQLRWDETEGGCSLRFYCLFRSQVNNRILVERFPKALIPKKNCYCSNRLANFFNKY